MRKNQVGRLNDCFYGGHIYLISLHHLVCDAGQSSDLGRYRRRPLLQAAVNAGDIPHRAVIIICERNEANLDDFVGLVI